MAGRLSMALVHGPVLDRHGGVQTTALTNLDVHDMARSGRTYDVAAFYVVSPVEAQRQQALHIIGFWEGEAGIKRNKDRSEAMSRVVVVASIDDAIADVTQKKQKPLVVATSAKPQGARRYEDLRRQLEEGDDDVLLLFGTGHGLTQSVLDRCDLVLAPVNGPDGWNHLSVRSAAAIILDRLRGS